MIDPQTLSETIRRARTERALCRSVHSLNTVIDRIALRHAARCRACGRCCRFDEYGHLLYTTALELAVFAADMAHCGDEEATAAARRAANMARMQGRWSECPFLADGRCTAHAVRPAACRIFFCDGGQWQQDLYRDCHRRIRALHEHLGVPYAYFEWRAGLMLLADVQKFPPLV